MSTYRASGRRSHQIITETTRNDGIGAYDRDRLARSIGQVAKAFGLTRVPELVEIYDDRFLPPRDERIPLNWRPQAPSRCPPSRSPRGPR
jgi:hypothetical protein